MRINNRERILLMLLILVVGGWVLFDYVIEEQFKEIEEKKLELRLKESELSDLEGLIEEEATIDSQIAEYYNAIQSVAMSYFNTTPQEELVLLMTDFLLMPFIEESSIAFSESKMIDVAGVNFMKDTISIAVTGQYESLINMLKTIWTFPKKIDVSSINISGSGYDEISANISLDLYTFAAESGLVDNLYKWYIDDLFEKQNPFAEAVESNTIVRYLYMPDEDIFNYSKYFEFTDIEGHWNQSEIEHFLDEGYLYLNPYLEFGPDEPITRGEFIVLLDSYYGWPTIYDDEYDLTDFRDYEDLGSLESSFAKAIHKGYLSGVVEGYGDNTLRPRAPISYEEVEFLMNRIKDTNSFSWSTVASGMRFNKGVDEERWNESDGQLTRAEAVYLLYYFD